MSSKKLAVPFIVLSLAAFGCSSSSSGGAAGAGGGSAGTGAAGIGAAGTGAAGTDAGAAGTGAAGTGAAGADAGAAGTGADAAAGTGADAAAGAGVDGSVDIVVDSGADAVNLAADEALCATKRTEAMSAVAYSTADFCAVYMDICGATAFTGALTSGDCAAMYNSWAGKTVTGGTSVQSCVTYHVCNAQTMDKTVHCPHAAGMAPCAP